MAFAGESSSNNVVTAGDARQALASVPRLPQNSNNIHAHSDADSAATVKVAGASIDVPSNASDGVDLKRGNTRLTIRLPGAAGAQQGHRVADGVVAYPSNQGFANAVQSSQDGSVRMLTVIDSREAPQNYDYKLNMPDGRIELLPNGGAIVLDRDGKPISFVDPAWAKDANGKPVRTWYTTNGTTLTQHVAHNQTRVAYPIVADPWFRWYWNGVVITLSRNEMLYVWYGGTQALLGLIAIPGVGWATLAGVLWVSSYAGWAYTNHKCAWFWLPYWSVGGANAGFYNC